MQSFSSLPILTHIEFAMQQCSTLGRSPAARPLLAAAAYRPVSCSRFGFRMAAIPYRQPMKFRDTEYARYARTYRENITPYHGQTATFMVVLIKHSFILHWSPTSKNAGIPEMGAAACFTPSHHCAVS